MNQCEYETVYGLLYPGNDTFILGGDSWVIKSLTKRNFVFVIYDGDTVK